MSSFPVSQNTEDKDDRLQRSDALAQVLKATSIEHAALKRLRTRLSTAGEDTGASIKSYDRMYHRHSRS